jgi:hypothetical protein
MNEFKTPNGTILPLLDLKGQKYLKPAHRLVWFLETFPKWSIENKIEQITDKMVIMKCEIKDETGRLRAISHKTCAMGKMFPLESAETGAMGRALALCGFGTQFTDDFDTDDLADSPLCNKEIIPECAACGSMMLVSKDGAHYFCKNWQDKTVKHPTIPRVKS